MKEEVGSDTPSQARGRGMLNSPRTRTAYQERLDILSSRSPDLPSGQSIKRILREWQEISTSPNAYWSASPVNPDEPYEWHFTIRGPQNTAFENGIYHGRLVLPSTYPMTPPTLFFMTPNGRFEVHKKVCLSATDFHPECWQPAWGIRSILDAIHAFFPTPAEGAVHALDWPDHSRRQLAESSSKFVCPVCQRSNQEIVETECTSLPSVSCGPPLGFTSVSRHSFDEQQEMDINRIEQLSATFMGANSVGTSKADARQEQDTTAPFQREAQKEEEASVKDKREKALKSTTCSNGEASKVHSKDVNDEPLEEQLEAIRRRRTPSSPQLHGDDFLLTDDVLGPFKMLLPRNCPSIFVFFCYLVIFLTQVITSSLCYAALRIFGSSANRRMPLHYLTVLVCFAVSMYGFITLLAFVRKVFVETFFLFDVPLRQSFQESTNPSLDQIRPLSNAERFQAFPLHPFINYLLNIIWPI